MSDEKIKKQLLENNQAINWVPDYIKEGRFGEWLREVKDWALSRERYWGTPLPIWQCQTGQSQKSKVKSQNCCNNIKVIGSVNELEKLSGRDLKNLDLHKPFVDEIVFPCKKCGGEMRRVPEVADCWFDSGSMPFAQWHYPFENKEKIDQGGQFPADFISEAIDQTRGWFYTLLAVSTLLGHGTPYKNVICLGHLRDAKGEKMSKSKENVIDPWDVINQYGADAVRWFFYTINQPGDPKNFDLREVDAGVKKLFLIISNVLNFYQTHATESQKSKVKSQNYSGNVLDKWIAAKLNLLVKDTTAKLNNYDVVSAARELGVFVNELSTWWLRRSRGRFKGEEREQQQALDVLHFTLLTLSKLIAPFTPFIAEKIYQEVKGEKESVHLEEWPKSDEALLDEKVLREMEVARKIVEMAHALRAEAKIKVRQPLSLLQVQGAQVEPELLEIILDEVNVKKGEMVEQLEQKDGYVIKSEGAFGVGLCVALDEELKKEGLLRELTRQINGLRKEAGLKIIDQVDVLLFTDDELIKAVVEARGEGLKKSVVGKSVKLVKAKAEAKWQGEFEIDGVKLWVGLNL